ncbi:MAG: bifunctional 5,10-methylenetetrahydrofolate dehydrogenase/5,10-methenyltetrahydrofolate cyclohydrolase [Kosmotoga sp.]|nr:MAG: bifunctional 5,10-methylenetetrahydrofolate dehydrogenase/5,10-methenyltetrahydrofolate cyclohydrolase [Kosmotoga sp.]
MSRILSGKKLADSIYEEIEEAAKRLKKKPKMVIYTSEPDKATRSYMKSIRKQGDKLNFEIIEQEASMEPEKDIEKINKDGSINGVMIMHPLKNVPHNMIADRLKPEKDIEGRTAKNFGWLALGKPIFKPPTAEAVMEILDYYDVDLKGKDVTIVGRSTTVGMPLALLMLKKGVDATVTVCHSRTQNIENKMKSADILVVAVGKANFVSENAVKNDATVIDVGINFLDGKMVGDVNFNQVKDKVSNITPVPGGVGTVTTALLFKHLINATIGNFGENDG